MRGTSVGTSVWRRDIEGKAEQAAGCAVEREAESATPLRGGGVGLCVTLGRSKNRPSHGCAQKQDDQSLSISREE